MLPTMDTKFIPALLLYVASFFAFAESQTPALSHEEGKNLGLMAKRVVQTGHFLEVLTTGECKQYALEAHMAAEDLSHVMKTLPRELKELKEMKGFSQELDRRAREQAVRDINTYSREMTTNGTSAVVKCGILFGIGSTTYYQAKQDWNTYLGLQATTWKQP
jgi:hypothetical protein